MWNTSLALNYWFPFQWYSEKSSFFFKYLIFFTAVALTSNICLAGGSDANKQKVTVVATPAPQIKIDQPAESTPAPDADYWDNDDFVPFQSNRHDEFDWKLTKALMLTDPSNMILSPFSVKLLLSLLSEAGGAILFAIIFLFWWMTWMVYLSWSRY